ncbi:MAG: lysophospholipid acyltransferase family protein [Phycisphaerales bacterium]
MIWATIFAGGWLVWAALCRRLLDNPSGDVYTGLAWYLTRHYSRLFHRLRVEGIEHLPRGKRPGPLVVVMNHTAGIDPILVQAVCRFPIRFVMATDMRHPAGEWFWRWREVIFVDRVKGEATGAREALRHLARGGVLGIFPEGGIERPPSRLLPFQPGVGLILARAKAPVLCVTIRDTPSSPTAWQSLVTPSRSVVTFHPTFLPDPGQSAKEIAADLQRRFREYTGWDVR